jgi:hypothetical protein
MSTASLAECPVCTGTCLDRDLRACEECTDGEMSCCYCHEPATAGKVDIGLTYGEWQCTDCNEQLESGRISIATLQRARERYEAACEALGDERRQERAS